MVSTKPCRGDITYRAPSGLACLDGRVPRALPWAVGSRTLGASDRALTFGASESWNRDSASVSRRFSHSVGKRVPQLRLRASMNSAESLRRGKMAAGVRTAHPPYMVFGPDGAEGYSHGWSAGRPQGGPCVTRGREHLSWNRPGGAEGPLRQTASPRSAGGFNGKSIPSQCEGLQRQRHPPAGFDELSRIVRDFGKPFGGELRAEPLSRAGA